MYIIIHLYRLLYSNESKIIMLLKYIYNQVNDILKNKVNNYEITKILEACKIIYIIDICDVFNPILNHI